MTNMATLFFNAPNFIYWLLLACVIVFEAMTFGHWWRRRENSRWTLGYATVFGLGIPMVSLGYWDIVTWAALFFGVGISGAIKVGLDNLEKSYQAEFLRRQRPETTDGQNTRQ